MDRLIRVINGPNLFFRFALFWLRSRLSRPTLLLSVGLLSVLLLVGGAEFGRLYIGFRLSQRSLQGKDLFTDEFILESRTVLETFEEVCEGDLVR